MNPLVLKSTIDISCPDCFEKQSNIGTWGTYPTIDERRTRFRCKTCNKTFNLAKIPEWKDNIAELIWKLSQLSIENSLSINAIAKQWNIPYSTIQSLIVEIKTILADQFEQAKILQEVHFAKKEKSNKAEETFKVIFYDEGFLKLLGLTGYLVFTLDGKGNPITVKIETDRSAETIHNHFLSAITQLGGVDVIIADGAPAILCAIRGLRQDLLFIQQIHSGTAKRARIYKLETIPNRKAMIETVIELHTGSLIPNTESKIRVKKSLIFPKNISGSSKKPPTNNKTEGNNISPVERTGVLTPEESTPKKKFNQKRSSNLLKGEEILLNTGNSLDHLELSILESTVIINPINELSLPTIHGMLLLGQKVLPNQFITSNRAEVFNAVHDHFLKYQGRKS
ncbi:MAG: hypothetical protein ACC656_08760, partial [Candidatus Heimdallarchaeota archaeon]